MVERNCGNEMMENMGLNDAMHDVRADESKIAIYGRSSAASKVPYIVVIVGKLAIGMLKICDGDCARLKLVRSD